MANRRPLTLTHERLLEAFTYNPEEGTFRWNAGVSKSNGGDVAGYHDQHTGYWHIESDGRKYKASRLAWFYMSGEWPALVDHANLVKCDDRWANLRIATISQNEANKRIGSRNKSGFKGVHLHKTSGLWRACITVNKVQKFLGYFKDPAVAHSAYREAAVQAFGEFARFE